MPEDEPYTVTFSVTGLSPTDAYGFTKWSIYLCLFCNTRSTDQELVNTCDELCFEGYLWVSKEKKRHSRLGR